MEKQKGISKDSNRASFSPDFPGKFGYTRGGEEMKEILRYLAYHLSRQLDGRGGIRGYYRARLGDVQLVKIHSYPRHIPAKGCTVRGRHSWNVGIIFYRDPFFLFTRPCYVGFVKVTWLAGHFPNLLHFCRESFHFVAEKLKNEFSRVDFPDIENVSTKSIDVSDLNCKG